MKTHYIFSDGIWVNLPYILNYLEYDDWLKLRNVNLRFKNTIDKISKIQASQNNINWLQVLIMQNAKITFTKIQDKYGCNDCIRKCYITICKNKEYIGKMEICLSCKELFCTSHTIYCNEHRNICCYNCTWLCETCGKFQCNKCNMYIIQTPHSGILYQNCMKCYLLG